MHVYFPIRSSRFKDIALYLPIFFIFFLIGIVGGRAAGMLLSVKTSDTSYPFTVKSLGNGQRNLVLMLVNENFAGNPELEGIWLLITHPQSSAITLVPVNPGDNERSRKLYESFTVSEDSLPGLTFLDVMSEYLLWDDYLLIDQQGLASVFNNFDSAADDTLHVVSSPRSTRLSIEEQTKLWKSMCAYLSQVDEPEQMVKLVQQVSPHFSSSLSWDDLPLYPWAAENYDGNLSCDFPTLIMKSP
jgi:hypothetical protein